MLVLGRAHKRGTRSRWWFLSDFLFPPLFGEMISHVDYSNIFQMGWFNHQLEGHFFQTYVVHGEIVFYQPTQRSFFRWSLATRIPVETAWMENGPASQGGVGSIPGWKTWESSIIFRQLDCWFQG